MSNISYVNVWIFTLTIICPNLSSAEITVSSGSREVVDSASATFTVSCQIGSLSLTSGQVTNVEWKLGDTILSDDDTYTPDVGTASYEVTNATQTTTLEVAGSGTTRSNMQFTCVVTDPSDFHGATTKSANPELRFYTVTSVAKNVTTAVEQTLICTMSKLDTNHAAEVAWKDPTDAEVLLSDTTNYAMIPGTVNGDGTQNTELTIKQAKMATFPGKSSFTYKCSVTSSQYPKSPPSPDVEVVAAILKLAVTAVNKEQLAGTVATISCIVSGLTQVLDEVKWTLSDGTAIISGQDSYTIFTGEDSFSGDTQITTLAVTAAQNNVDNTYDCLISSTEHAETDKSTTVNLKVFTVTSTPKSVTTDTAQTLNCHIGGLDDSKGISVTWKDPDDVQVKNTDTGNYVLDLGPVTDDGNQKAELYITQAKMATCAGKSLLNYKCSVTSLQYTESPSSADQDVVLLIQTLQAVNKELLEGTEAKISCVVTGLTKVLDKVEWKTSDNTTITPDNGDGFIIDTGSFGTGSQTTTLTVPGSQTDEDKVYKCVITPNGDDVTAKTTEVNLKVFTVSSTPKYVTTDTDQTLTCTIGGLDANQAVTVTWKEPSNKEVEVTDTVNYALSPGTVNNDGSQNAVLTIKQNKIKEYSGDSSFIYKCSVTSSQYSDSPSSADQDVVANVEPHEERQGIETSAIIGAAIGGVILVFGAAGFAFAIFKKTAVKVGAAAIEVTYEGSAGTVHTNPHNFAGN